MINKIIPPVDSFPKDNKLRVVWAYGAVYRNIGATRIPEINIMLIEILPNGELSTNYTFKKISVAQLDTVRYMTLWLGNRRTDKFWINFGSYYKTNKLFSLDSNTSSSIYFIEKKPSFAYSYFPPYRYKITGIKNKNDYWSFANSTFTKIESKNGITVIIPSMELFTSTYTPWEQKIRYKLIQKSLDNVLSEYIKAGKIIKGKYHIELYDGKVESNIAFLAYAKFNTTTRQRLSRLRSSLEKTSQFPERYPIILPYHPTTIDLKGDGIWLDKTTFFMFRINQYSQPIDNKIESYSLDIEHKKDKGKDKNKSYVRAEKEIEEEDIPITNNHSPHRGNGSKHIKSEVSLLNPGIIEYKKDILNITGNTSMHIDHENIDNIQQLSSSESNYLGASMNVGKIIIEGDTPNLKQLNVLQMVLDSLYYMIDKKINISDNKREIYIDQIFFIDENCIMHTNQVITQFYSILKNTGKKTTSWVKKQKRIKHKTIFLGYRNYMLIKILLSNGKHIYLLEIDRKDDNEGFLGMLFNTESPLNKISLSELLYNIMKKKGALKNIRMPFLKAKTYRHSKGKTKTLNNNITKIIKEALENNIFC